VSVDEKPISSGIREDKSLLLIKIISHREEILNNTEEFVEE